MRDCVVNLDKLWQSYAPFQWRSSNEGQTLASTCKALVFWSIEKTSVSEEVGGKVGGGREQKVVLTPFPNKPMFLCTCSTSLFKTLLEKEKLLITSHFSFFNSVFYHFEVLFLPFSSNLKFLSAKSFKVPIAANWKGVCLQNTSKPHSYHLKIWWLLWLYG